ncbi:HAMP domain-containing sensor histidine kinase [Niallia sp. XMNu-256]|uniref:sensor histidine kinase n=1 Tax=Niallia sp. XMNu-256 TaxID=3082444 RepID=UPI0030CF3103
MKLRNKINFSTSFLFIGLFIISNIAIYFVFSHLIVDREISESKAETEKIAEGFNESLGQISIDTLLRAYLPVDGMIQIVKENGKPLPPVTSPSEKNLSTKAAQYFSNEIADKIEFQGKQYSFVSLPVILADGEVANLQIIKSIQRAVDDLATLRLVLFIVTIIVMIPVLISSRLLSRVITRPITSLIETMTDIRKSGHFKRIQLNDESKDELNKMGETFNHMIDLLETNFEKQEQFVSNASHELRTPLTIIESYSSLLKRRGMKEPQLFDESVEAIHSEAIRMKDMIEQLLLLAKHEEEWNIKLQKIDLGTHVQQTIKVFENAYHRNIDFKVFEGKIETLADDQKLKQLTFIILDNARKYSDDVITVEVGIKSDKPFVKIIDRGIGIPKQDLPKIFDRFYRVDKARSRKMGGSGLGLSLAKEIAEAMSANMFLESVEGIGTTVTIELSPLN